jgi:predicted nucleic acid-binding protein
MLNPNYVSQRSIGKFASVNDIKSSKVWYNNVVKPDKVKEDLYQRYLLRMKYPKRTLIEIENLEPNSMFSTPKYLSRALDVTRRY